MKYKDHARNEATAYSGWWKGKCSLMYVEVQGSRMLLRNAGRCSLWPVLMMRLACGNLSECSCEDSNSRVKSDKPGPRTVRSSTRTMLEMKPRLILVGGRANAV